MLFVFNNLSISSLPTLAKEFSESVNHICLPWIAQYLVRRAGVEPNLHILFMAFIDYLEDVPLERLVLRETYSQIRIILLADHSFTERSLKHLGHWLGLQTLTRDIGIPEERLPLKEIILSAAHKDLSALLCLLSFVSQLLDHSVHSRIFSHLIHGLWISYFCWVSFMSYLALISISVW